MSDVLERAAPGFRPKVALILGSGLGGFVEEVAAIATIPYADLPGFPQPTVGGHAGRLVLGHVGPTPVAVLQGRAHYYERGRADEMKGAIDAMAALGCEILLQTNAAGSLRLDMPPGSVMAISDHINFTGVNPLFGVGTGDNRFVDMVDAYDPALRMKLMEAARAANVVCHEGVYIFFSGPSFETPAEIRAMANWGADMVGMSTVLEVIAARHLAMQVLALSLATNQAAGMSGEKLSGEEVIAVGKDSAPRVAELLRKVLVAIDHNGVIVP